MSQSGELVFFVPHEPSTPKSVLAAVFEHLSPTGTFELSRVPSPANEWDEFLTDTRAQSSEILIDPCAQLSGVDLRVYEASDLPEVISYRADAALALASWSPDHVLTASCIPCTLADRISIAVRAGVPKSILGRFAPVWLAVVIGRHDLFDHSEHEEGLLFGQPYLSIKFYGYGVPDDWKEARARILELPEVRAARQELESFLGPMEQCVYWNA